MFKDFSCGSFFYPRYLVPRFPPAPSPPRGVKGSLNTQFGFVSPDRDVEATACDAGLLASNGERGSRSQRVGAWRGCESGTARASASGRGCGCARSALRRVQGERSERAHAAPLAIGRAEQRSGDRIRAGAGVSVASLRTTPGGASSARHPEGARPLARLSFAYLFFGEAKKSKSANRPKPDLKKPID